MKPSLTPRRLGGLAGLGPWQAGSMGQSSFKPGESVKPQAAQVVDAGADTAADPQLLAVAKEERSRVPDPGGRVGLGSELAVPSWPGHCPPAQQQGDRACEARFLQELVPSEERRRVDRVIRQPEFVEL
ncbi:hypothetical protein H920_15079 [Fukomys damarensis]|uniref:Uncharacterized protein n=1 Tax=Fukomys damarensis TaxID=885580 RepID=A0A091CXQ0_FUKDA|nr:hypothetical protein H920_15079 [Fukomys damarensis]